MMEGPPNNRGASVSTRRQGNYYEITEDNVDSYYTSSVLQGEVSCTQACVKFMCEILSVENCLRFLVLAEGTGDERFLATLREFILKHIGEVKFRPEFLELSSATIDTLLIPMTTLEVDADEVELDYSPSELFLSVYEWMSAKGLQRVIKFDQILEVFPLELVAVSVLKGVAADERLKVHSKIVMKFLDAVVKKYEKDVARPDNNVIVGDEVEGHMDCDCALNQEVEAAPTSAHQHDVANEGDSSQLEMSISEETEPARSVAGSATSSLAVLATPECSRSEEEPPVDPAPVSARSSSESVNGIVDQNDLYVPTKWLSEVMPKLSPYFPQVGDDLVYLRQGHELYVKEVKKTRAYSITADVDGSLPYKQDPNLPAEVSVRLVDIVFKNWPPRLVILTLKRTDWKSKVSTGGSFLVRYHDLPKMDDFLVLRQVYDYALKRRWKNGDRFRSLRGSTWRTGEITLANSRYQPWFPDSHYRSFLVAWDDLGSYQQEKPLSPWDLEVITDDFNSRVEALPAGVTRVPLSRKELFAKVREVFPRKSEEEDEERKRISNLLELIIKLPNARQFLCPHDPEFDSYIDYPMSLWIIKQRWDNSFYRHDQAFLIDSDQIALNAAEACFSRGGLLSAKVFSRLLRAIFSDVTMTETSLMDAYHRLCQKYEIPSNSGEIINTPPGTSKDNMNGNSSAPLKHSTLTAKGKGSSGKFTLGESRKASRSPSVQLSRVEFFDKSIITNRSLLGVSQKAPLSNPCRGNTDDQKVVKVATKPTPSSSKYACTHCDYQTCSISLLKEHNRRHL